MISERQKTGVDHQVVSIIVVIAQLNVAIAFLGHVDNIGVVGGQVVLFLGSLDPLVVMVKLVPQLVVWGFLVVIEGRLSMGIMTMEVSHQSEVLWQSMG